MRPIAVHCPGLYKATKNYAVTAGFFWPFIYIDPQVEGSGANAIIAHETCHAARRHALRGVAILIVGILHLAAGIFLEWWPLALYSLIFVGLWFLYVKKNEKDADQYSIRTVGLAEYRAMLYRLKDRPSGWFDRWCYGSSRAVRYRRATGSKFQ